MSYKTYITEALVCGARASNTSDKSFLLFTREAGMLYASAKSVREERSKQRYGLQEFSYIRVTLIHGKSGWRITGVEPIQNVYALQGAREARALVRNIIRLLRRLIQGEVPHSELYDEVKGVITRMHEGREEIIEEVLTLRILHSLGYIAPHPELGTVLSTDCSIDVILDELEPEMKQARKAIIEGALRESHL
jgi:DNA repair protein RecO